MAERPVGRKQKPFAWELVFPLSTTFCLREKIELKLTILPDWVNVSLPSGLLVILQTTHILCDQVPIAVSGLSLQPFPLPFRRRAQLCAAEWHTNMSYWLHVSEVFFKAIDSDKALIQRLYDSFVSCIFESVNPILDTASLGQWLFVDCQLACNKTIDVIVILCTQSWRGLLP